MAEESEFKDKANSNKTAVANTKQPFGPLKKEVPEGKANAIKRRLEAKKKAMGKK